MDWSNAFSKLNDIASKVTETVAPLVKEAFEEVPDETAYDLDDVIQRTTSSGDNGRMEERDEEESGVLGEEEVRSSRFGVVEPKNEHSHALREGRSYEAEKLVSDERPNDALAEVENRTDALEEKTQLTEVDEQAKEGTFQATHAGASQPSESSQVDEESVVESLLDLATKAGLGKEKIPVRKLQESKGTELLEHPLVSKSVNEGDLHRESVRALDLATKPVENEEEKLRKSFEAQFEREAQQAQLAMVQESEKEKAVELTVIRRNFLKLEQENDHLIRKLEESEVELKNEKRSRLSCEAELKQLSTNSNHVESMLKKQLEEGDELSVRMSALEMNLETVTTERNSVKQELAEMRQSNAVDSKRSQLYETECKTLKATLDEALEGSRQQSEIVHRVEAENGELKRRIDFLQQQQRISLEAMNEPSTSPSQPLPDSDARFSADMNFIETLENKVTQTLSELQTFEVKNESFAKALEEKDQETEKLRVELTAMSRALEEIQAERDELKPCVHELRREHEQLIEQHSDELAKVQQEAVGTIRETEARMMEAQEELKALEVASEQQREQEQRTQGELQRQMTELVAVKEKAEELRAQAMQVPRLQEALQQRSEALQEMETRLAAAGNVDAEAVAESAGEISQLKADLLQKVEELSQLEAALSKAQEDKLNMADELNKAMAFNQSLSEQVQVSGSELEAMNTKKQQSESTFRTRLAELEAKIGENEQEKEKLLDDYEVWETKIVEAEKVLKKMGEIEAELEMYRAQAAESSDSAVKARNELEDLKKGFEQKTKREEELAERNRELTSTVRSQLDELDILRAQVRTATSETRSFQVQHEDLVKTEQSLQALSNEYSTTKVDMKIIQDDRDRLTSEILNLNSTLAALQGEVNKANEKYKNKTSEYQGLQSEKEGLVSKLKLISPRLQKLEALEAEKTKLALEVKHLRATIEQLRQRRLSQTSHPVTTGSIPSHSDKEMPIGLTATRVNSFDSYVDDPEYQADGSMGQTAMDVDEHVKAVIVKKLLIQYFGNKQGKQKDILSLLASVLSMNNRERRVLGLNRMDSTMSGNLRGIMSNVIFGSSTAGQQAVDWKQVEEQVQNKSFADLVKEFVKQDI